MDTAPVQQAPETTNNQWICPGCGKVWSTSWAKCSKCGTPRPVKQVSAAELGLSQQEFNFYSWMNQNIATPQMQLIQEIRSLNSKLGFIVAVIVIGIIIQILSALLR
jgi:hypothetical protein